MKLNFSLDLQDNRDNLANDLSRVIAMVLGSTYALTRNSGQFTNDEIKEADSLGGGSAPAQLPQSAAPALPTSNVVNLPPANTTPASAGSADLDVTGIPHDPRIHAKPAAGNAPTKNADGRWKKKKGIDDATFAAVTSELLRIVGGATPATLPAAAQLPASTPLPTIQADQPAPTALPQLPPVLPVVADKPIEVVDFPSFAEWSAQQSVKHPEKYEGLLNQILTHYGLVDAAGAPQLPLLAHKANAEPGIINTFHNWLRVQL